MEDGRAGTLVPPTGEVLDLQQRRHASVRVRLAEPIHKDLSRRRRWWLKGKLEMDVAGECVLAAGLAVPGVVAAVDAVADPIPNSSS